MLLAESDYWGTRLPGEQKPPCESVVWLKERVVSLDLEDSRPKPILLGRHLLEMGFSPGPKMGELLDQAFQLQLEGELNELEDAILWAKKMFNLLSNREP